jgi:sarcosine oxidase gamma subunit
LKCSKNLADDFTYINEDGEFFGGRQAYMDIVLKSPAVVEASTSDERIAVHGTTGVATGQFTAKDTTGSDTTRHTEVFAKGPDGWKVVASPETKAKQSSAKRTSQAVVGRSDCAFPRLSAHV